MDKATLVGKRDREVEGLVLDALSKAEIPVTLFDWDYVPELEELQLVIATPLYDSEGPHEANLRILNALSEAGIYQDMPIRRIFVKSPQDPTVKALERELKFRTEGSIHIVEYEKPNPRQRYSVIFAPYTGPGGAVPSKPITGDAQLRDFLEKRLEIGPNAVNDAFSELRTKGNASITNVQLTARKAKKLGLA